MEFFVNIRLRFGKALLRKRVSRNRRKVLFRNFKDVRSIGIVWNASKHEEFIALAKFHQMMQERNINVKILGFYHGKYLPDQYTAIRYLSCIRKAETNLFYIPYSSGIQSFIDFNFDVLIDINFEKIFTLRYITTLSKAAFRVGLFGEEETNGPFDLMMDIKKPVKVEDYLKQVIQYLEMINS